MSTDVIQAAMAILRLSATAKRLSISITTDGTSIVADCFNCQSRLEIRIRQGQVEAVVEPDSVGDDVGRESVTFIGIHEPILAISAPLSCQYPQISNLTWQYLSVP